MPNTDTAAEAPEQPDEKTFDLKKPIEHNGLTVSSFTLREPTAGEMRQIRAQPELDQQIFAVSLISGVPKGAVEKMPIGIVEHGENYLSGFIPPARKIGAG